MGKTIRVSDKVYQELCEIQAPRESFSEVIARAVQAYITIRGIRDGLPASHYLQERAKEEMR
uniref:Putative antitoxin n=1 Tax=viral metagenome TaxID=1070528 RepID=A0A6M3M3F6_9ZZZZ